MRSHGMPRSYHAIRQRGRVSQSLDCVRVLDSNRPVDSLPTQPRSEVEPFRITRIARNANVSQNLNSITDLQIRQLCTDIDSHESADGDPSHAQQFFCPHVEGGPVPSHPGGSRRSLLAAADADW